MHACICAAALVVAYGVELPRIAALIIRLGDARFVEREAASRALAAAGNPAVEPLRRVAFAHSEPEVRRRAEAALRTIESRHRRAELAKWHGSWVGDGGAWMKVAGDRWSSGTPAFGPVGGRIRVIAVRGDTASVDLEVEFGPSSGRTCRAILRRRDGHLDYCGTYTAGYPTEFRNGGAFYAVTFTREKK